MSIKLLFTSVLLWNSFQICSPCAPKGAAPPEAVVGGCMKQRGGDAQKIVGAVNESDTYCTYKYAWTSGGSVSNAPGVKDGEYLKVFGYNEPIADAIVPSSGGVKFDPNCGASTPNKPNYAITQWFCLDWCERSCVDIQRRQKDGNTDYPFTSIACDHKGLECTDKINCKCTDTSGAECTMTGKGATATIGQMIDKYNTSCLNCHYNRTGAKCTWAALLGGSSSSSSSSGGSSQTSVKSSVNLRKFNGIQQSSSSDTTNVINNNSPEAQQAQQEVITDEQQAADDSNSVKTATQTWVNKNANSATTESPPPSPKLKLRKAPAIVSKPADQATDEEKAKANDPDMQKAVADAKARRDAIRAARAAFWNSVYDALKKYKGEKRQKIQDAVDKLKKLQAERKGLKGKARRENTKQQNEIMKQLAKDIGGDKKERNQSISDAASKKASDINKAVS